MSFARYVVVQLVAYALDIGTFAFLIAILSLEPIFANAIGKLSAGAFAFTAHRVFTFHSAYAEGFFAQAIRYSLLLGLNIPLSSAVLSGVSYVVEPVLVAKIAADGICVFLTYLVSKTFVFRPSS